jgi:transposase-like protein
MRSLFLWMMTWRQGRPGSAWPAAVPWLLWLWQEVGRFWPWLLLQAEWRCLGWLLWQGQRLVFVGLAAGWVRDTFLPSGEGAVATQGDSSSSWLFWGLGTRVKAEEGFSVTVAKDEKGYEATLDGRCTVRVGKDDPFRKRLLIIFLSLLDDPEEGRSSRRTRDGRRPAVRQEELAYWFGVPQPDISRWLKYWLAGDWRRLHSLHTAEILTLELQQRIVRVFARFPWWCDEEVHRHLQEQGVAVGKSQVHQAAKESGWSCLREQLRQRYHLTAESFRLKEDYVLNQLLGQVETLLAKLENGGNLTPEEHLDLAEWKTFCSEVGLASSPPLKALPWMMRVERVIFGEWETVSDGKVRCPYCGSDHVARKSKQPRLKWYYDEQGQLQSLEVYRFYCRNKKCTHGSFTNLPPGLVLYSRYRLDLHLQTLQAYTWGQSKYRLVATSLGVSSQTAYRWVTAFGEGLLPVAALFGVVKSSGAMGVDEKYVLVPDNDKPEGKMRRWMYVYLAVDAYTYDLLHIAIYPNNTKESALAFLLAVRAKGYHPRVVVTDLRTDYGPVIAQVFPKASHHLCLFHAAQEAQRHIKEVYGAGYAKTHPEAQTLKALIYAALDARTKRTAQDRHDQIMHLRQQYVAVTPGSAAIFDFLETHWLKLVNAIESDLIPTTNNTVELVIRRFDQHYQNFCGFQSIATAQQYLGVFEKVYRFTPFSQDAQKSIRGKSPLQLAGYDLSRLPMTSICSGLSLAWPIQVFRQPVPKL